MINFNTLFKVSYGMYIVCSGDDKSGNGFISNTVFQVTSEPAKFASCCNKNNYTAGFIEKHGCFSVSVLPQTTTPEIFGRFGYKSGRDSDKLAGMNIKYGKTGVPIVLNESIAWLECKVVEKFDVGTHWLFIGELIDAEILDGAAEPMTYSYYHQVKKGAAPKNAPTYLDKSKLGLSKEPDQSSVYKCAVCGHIYDEKTEGVKFSDLPDNWKCPDCGADKEDFFKI
jgi:flavin reductase (DIM6/NTAB) family NADH-FMN oxidoreductase RutF/rubredoxin